MSWLRIDDGFTSHAKVASLTDAEFRVWVRLLCYCAKSQRPIVDELPRAEVTGLSQGRIARFRELDLLVEMPSESESISGVTYDLQINDWEKFNPPKDRTQAERAKRYRKRKKVETSRTPSRVTSPVTDSDASRVTNRDALARARVPVPYPSPVNTETVPEPEPYLHTDADAPPDGTGAGFQETGEGEVIDFQNILRDMDAA